MCISQLPFSLNPDVKMTKECSVYVHCVQQCVCFVVSLSHGLHVPLDTDYSKSDKNWSLRCSSVEIPPALSLPWQLVLCWTAPGVPIFATFQELIEAKEEDGGWNSPIFRPGWVCKFIAGPHPFFAVVPIPLVQQRKHWSLFFRHSLCNETLKFHWAHKPVH